LEVLSNTLPALVSPNAAKILNMTLTRASYKEGGHGRDQHAAA
jgi:hypothetical protein